MKRQEKELLRKLAKSNIKANKMQNIVLKVAIIAVSTMLFTIIGAGISYYENFSTMNIRLKGTTAQGFISDITETERGELGNINEITDIGKQYFVGTVNHLENQPLVAVSAYDEKEWNYNILPTLKEFTGKRPENEDEILLSEAAVKALKQDAGKVRDKEIEIALDINGEAKVRKFKIVGTFEDFVASSVRNAGSISGNVLAASLELQKEGKQPTANCIVSEIFAQRVCDTDDIYSTFRIAEGEDIEQIIADRLGLDRTDQIMIVDSNSNGAESYIGILLAIVICFIVCLCGYLCIYNIMNISLIKDIHFWANMKAIGTGTRQLKYIADCETRFFLLRSLPIGLVIGTLLTFGLVPLMLKTFVGSGGYSEIMPVTMKYNLWVYAAAILFCSVTVFLSFRKSLRILASMSPMEALRFTGHTSEKKVGIRKDGQSRCKGKAYKMAWHNVLNDKKNFFLVVLTLFMGLFIFLLSYTLFSSPNWDLYLDTEAPNDFCITDLTLINNFKNRDNPKALKSNYLTESQYKQLAAMQGISTIEKECLQPVLIESQNGLSFYTADGSKEEEMWGTAVQVSETQITDYQLAHDKQYTQEDMDEYLSGERVYVSAAKTGEYPEIEGKEIRLRNQETGKEAVYIVAGVLLRQKDLDSKSDNNPDELGATVSESFNERGKIRVFMSESGLKRLVNEPSIYRIKIDTTPEKEPYIKKSINEILDPNDNVIITVRSDLLPTYKPIANSFLVIGAVFSSILFIIGVMNFINSLCTSIYTREKELAVLASIGMAKKQIVKMLAYEGGYFAALTVALLATVGVGVIYLFMKLTKDQFYFLEFVPPVKILIILLIILGAICVLVPCITYKEMGKRSIVERLKK